MRTPDAHTGDTSTRHTVAYIGGYGSSILWMNVDPATGALSPSGSVTNTSDPSFLAIDPAGTALYAVSESQNMVAAYAIERTTGALTFINAASAGGNGPAHLSVDRSGRYVLVANYGDGTVAVLAIRADKGVAAPQQTLAPGAHAHMIITDASNRYAFVPCLGSDRVVQYTFDAQTGQLAPNGELPTAAGAGPRHLAFTPDGAHAYLMDELNSTVMALAVDGAGKLSALQTLPTVPSGMTNSGAEIAVTPSGAYVFSSNRGDDSIARFAVGADGTLSPLGRTPTGGKTPRQFTLDAAGKYMYVANQDGNSVTQFAIGGDGSLTPAGQPLATPRPTFVGLVTF